MLLVLLATLSILASHAQYEENPLKGKKWLTLSGGLSTADHISWQVACTGSSRGETMITQARLAYSQEFIEGRDDSATFRKNRILEAGLMWGDGWRTRKWYVNGSLGFGFNIRMYEDDGLYEDFRYLTAVTIGVPAQIEAGAIIGKKWGLGIVVLGNWNFRQPYVATHLGFVYRING